MSKVGSIFGIIGGTMMIIGGALGMFITSFLLAQINGLKSQLESIAGQSLTWEQLGLSIDLSIVLILPYIITIVWALIGIIGAIFGLKDKKFGNVTLLIVGLVATIGLFVNIYSSIDTLCYEDYCSTPISITIPLNSSLIIVDPILMLVGGIIGVIIMLVGPRVPKEKKQKKGKSLTDYSEKQYKKKLEKQTKKEIKKAKRKMGI